VSRCAVKQSGQQADGAVISAIRSLQRRGFFAADD